MRRKTGRSDAWSARSGRTILTIFILVMMMATVAYLPDEVEAQGPGRKDITFYLHNVTDARQVGTISTLRIMNTTMGQTLNTTVQTATSLQDDWYLYPVLADDMAIQGNVTVHMWALRTARTGDNRQASIEFTLYDVDASGVNQGTIATSSITFNMINDWREYSLTDSNVSRYTVPRGHSLMLYFEIHGSSSNYYQIAWGDASKRSRLDIETHDWARVDSVEVLDHDGVPRTNFMLTATDKSVTFRANVSDPYGGYDIRYANATLVGPGGSRILDMVPMTHTAGYFNSYHTEFSYPWNYTGYPTGQYNLTVHAVDNTGYYYRFPTNPGDTTYGGHQVSLTTSFWIGGSPHEATVNVVDSSNGTLAGAVVSIGSASGTTDGAGAVVLQVPNGTYELQVFWQDVRVYNGTATMLGDTTFNVTAAVHSPAIVVVDDVGAPVMDAVVAMEHPNGSVIRGYWRTDPNGSFGLVQVANGTYRLSVLWRDVEVFNDPLDIDGDGPFTITVRIYSLAVSVVDDVGDGISMAQVVVTDHATGLVTDSKLTNLTGVAMTRLPVGSYDFTVYWRNVLVFDDLQDHAVDASGDLTLHADVFQVNLTLEDTKGVPIEDASVVIGFSATGEVHDFGTTGADGGLATKLPVGSYDIWCYWRGVLVNLTEDLMVEGSGDHTIMGDVYWVEVTVLDVRDAPVSAAQVTLHHQTGLDFGTKITDDAGAATYRLPVGTYDVDVRWKDSPVYSGSHPIGSNDPVTLHVSVFYLDLTVVDSRSVPVESAIVKVVNATTSDNMGSAFTDAEGQTTFRLPTGRYDTTVVWQDTLVHEATHVMDGDLDQQVEANVFYVTFDAQDSRGEGLDRAQVVVGNSGTGRAMGGKTTDLDGITEYRLPIGEYDVEVLWQQSLVYLGTWTVDSDATDVLECHVYYATYHVVDADGIDLAGAQVSLANASAATALGPTATDSYGNVEFRLPAGNVAMTISWRSVVVYEMDPVSIEGDVQETIDAWVYYLSVKVVGSDGVKVGNADLNVERDGEVVTSAKTTGKGPEVFRLPVGHYWVNMTFRTTYHMTPIDVTSSEELDLDSNQTVTFKLADDEYPLPFYKTNLFWVVLAIALLLLAIVLLLYRMSKGAGGRDEDLDEPEEDKDEPEEDHEESDEGDEGSEDGNDQPEDDEDDGDEGSEDDEDTHVVSVPRPGQR